MKLKNILIFTALFLIIVSTLGFFGFSAIDHNGQFLCPISIIFGDSECQTVHHFSGLRFLTQPIINLYIILFIIPVIFIVFFYFPNLLNFSLKHYSYKNIELNSNPFKNFFAFIALLNKQDNYALW